MPIHLKNSKLTYETDMWNGIDLNESPHTTTYTGGVITAADADGVLQSSPANVPCLPGCRFADGTWLPTNSEGADLFTSTTRTVKPLNGPKTLVKDYGGDSDWQGQMVCPAMTNKVTCRKCNPTDTSGVTASGDTSITVVDKASVLAAGLGNICTLGKMYEVEITGISGNGCFIEGVTGNTNTHMGSAYILSAAGVTVQIRLSGTPPIDQYVEYTSLTKAVMTATTPTNTVQKLYLKTVSGVGSKFWFILPQLAESPYIGPILADPLDDRLATYTSSAKVISRPTAGTALKGQIEGQNFGVIGRVVPYASGQTSVWLLASYTDVNNYFGVYVSSAKTAVIKKISGTSYATSYPTTELTKDVIFEFILYQHANAGMGIKCKNLGGSWTAWSTKNDADGKRIAPVAASYQIGARDSLSQFYGSHQARLVTIPPNLADEAAVQAFMEKQQLNG